MIERSVVPSKRQQRVQVVYDHLLWSPYGIGQTIIFSYCRLFYLFSSFSLA